MDMNTLMREVLNILPSAAFGEDNEGQIVIYTDLWVVKGKDGVEMLVPYDEVP